MADVALVNTNQVGTNAWSDVEQNDQRLLDVVNKDYDSPLAEAAGVSIDGGAKRRGVTGIATEETTTSTTYTTLTTPDQVASVVLPSDGLLYVSYRALWKLTGATNVAYAAIFLGSTQAKAATIDGVPVAAEIQLAVAADNYSPLAPGVLTATNSSISGSATSDSSYVTTGQSLVQNTTVSPLVILEAAAGTYTVSVQFHVNATAGGTLSVKERKLWVKAEGY